MPSSLCLHFEQWGNLTTGSCNEVCGLQDFRIDFRQL